MRANEREGRGIDSFIDLCLFLSNTEEGLLERIHDYLASCLQILNTGLFLKDKGMLELVPGQDKINLSNLKINSELVSEIEKEEDYLFFSTKQQSFLKDFEEEYNLEHLLMMPLRDKNAFLGFLFFYLNDGGIIHNFELKKIKLIANILVLINSKERLFDKMEQRVAELLTLQTVSDFVNSTLDYEKLLDISLDALIGLIGTRTCSILIFTDKLFKDIHSRKQRGFLVSIDKSKNITVDLNKGIYGCLAKERNSISGYISDDTDDELDDLLFFDSVSKVDRLSYIIVPITRERNLIGTINIFDPIYDHLVNIDSNFLESFANQFSIALQNARLYKKKKEMANRDGLTDLFNHAFFQNRLSLLIEEGVDYELSLILIDIDDFKKVNDQYGHLMGDRVLRELSFLLKEHTREGDLIARYGGEEFALILPETGKKQAFSLAQRLRQTISSNRIELNDWQFINITVSMGLAVYNSCWSKESFIDRADRALYKAKSDGKNRIRTSKDT